MNRIFYIMGKSASGKDKIYGRLLEMEELNLKRIVLYTTRPRRFDEIHGKEYFFVTDEKLHQLEREGKLIESRSYNTMHGVWTYFTGDEGQFLLDQYDYLGIGTLESYEKMVAYFGKEVLCPVYVEVEDGERLRRALKRERKESNPKYTELCRRFLADSEDFCEERIQRAGIEKRFVNDDLENCIEEIKEYIRLKK